MRKYKRHPVSEGMFAIGTMGKNLTILKTAAAKLRHEFENIPNINLFGRFMKSGMLYTSEIYRRVTQTHSSSIKYQVENQIRYGTVYRSVQISHCDCTSFCAARCNAQYFALIKKYNVHPYFNIPRNLCAYIYKILSLSDEYDIVEIKNLISVCFYIKVKSTEAYIEYIMEPIDCLEND